MSKNQPKIVLGAEQLDSRIVPCKKPVTEIPIAESAVLHNQAQVTENLKPVMQICTDEMNGQSHQSIVAAGNTAVPETRNPEGKGAKPGDKLASEGEVHDEEKSREMLEAMDEAQKEAAKTQAERNEQTAEAVKKLEEIIAEVAHHTAHAHSHFHADVHGATHNGADHSVHFVHAGSHTEQAPIGAVRVTVDLNTNHDPFAESEKPQGATEHGAPSLTSVKDEARQRAYDSLLQNTGANRAVSYVTPAPAQTFAADIHLQNPGYYEPVVHGKPAMSKGTSMSDGESSRLALFIIAVGATFSAFVHWGQKLARRPNPLPRPTIPTGLSVPLHANVAHEQDEETGTKPYGPADLKLDGLLSGNSKAEEAALKCISETLVAKPGGVSPIPPTPTVTGNQVAQEFFDSLNMNGFSSPNGRAHQNTSEMKQR